jgi:hypothetical protein
MNTRLIKIIISVIGGLILLFYIGFSLNIGRALTPREFVKFSKTIIKAAILHPAQNGGLTAINLANQVLAQSEPQGHVLGTDQALPMDYTFPLPKYPATIYGERGLSSFATFAPQKEIEEYFNKTLPESGWSFIDRLGALYIYRGHGVQLNIEKRFYLTQDITELNFSLDTQSWTTYTNEKHGYSIEYPTRWYIDTGQSDSDYYQLEPYNFLVAGELYFSTDEPGKYNIANLPKNPFEVVFRIYKGDPNATFTRFFPEHKIDTKGAAKENININGMPGQKLVYTVVDSNTNETITSVDTFIKHDDRIFMFTYSGQPISEENRNIAERMIQSFKVK